MTTIEERAKAADALGEAFIGGEEHAAEALALCSAAFDKVAAFDLLLECSYASEETFCSSWDDTTVSQIMRGDVGPAGLGEVDAETVAKCHRLASRAGGWWVRNPNHPFSAPGFWLHFVPLSLCGCNDYEVERDEAREETRREVQRVLDSPCVSCRDNVDARADAERELAEMRADRDTVLRERNTLITCARACLDPEIVSRDPAHRALEALCDRIEGVTRADTRSPP